MSQEEKEKYRSISTEGFNKSRQQCAEASVPLRQEQQDKVKKPETRSDDVLGNVASLGSCYKVVEMVQGKGSYGTILVVQHHQLCNLFAAKVETCGATLQTEISILRGLDHPSFLPVISSHFVHSGFSWMIMPMIPTSLFSYVQKHHLQTNAQQGLFAQTMDGLSYLHTRNIVHCDIKPANILCNMTTVQFFIIDLGLALRVPLSSSSKRTCDDAYTLAYRPPELLVPSFTMAVFVHWQM